MTDYGLSTIVHHLNKQQTYPDFVLSRIDKMECVTVKTKTTSRFSTISVMFVIKNYKSIKFPKTFGLKVVCTDLHITSPYYLLLQKNTFKVLKIGSYKTK